MSYENNLDKDYITSPHPMVHTWKSMHKGQRVIHIHFPRRPLQVNLGWRCVSADFPGSGTVAGTNQRAKKFVTGIRGCYKTSHSIVIVIFKKVSHAWKANSKN